MIKVLQMVMHVVQWLRRSPKNWCEGNHQEREGEKTLIGTHQAILSLRCEGRGH
jgi:hypothetical protein